MSAAETIETLRAENTSLKSAIEDANLYARLVSAVLSFELAKDMVTGALWILSPESLTGRIARLSTYPEVLAGLWVCLAFLVLPYFLMQVFAIGQRYSIVITRLACRSILAGGVIWCYLGYLSKNLDYAYVTEIFIVTGLSCIAMAAVMANTLNSAQRRAQAGTV